MKFCKLKSTYTLLGKSVILVTFLSLVISSFNLNVSALDSQRPWIRAAMQK